MSNLKACIEKIRGYSNPSSFPEAQAKSSIIVPICECLGWDTSEPNQVKLEYKTPSGTKIDYAFFENNKPVILLEAKRPKQSLGYKQGRQLMGYAFEIGASLAVLTNGHHWLLYLLGGNYPWVERKFCSIDILDQEIDSICDNFNEFLGKDNVMSGSAVDNAKKILKNHEGEKKIKATVSPVTSSSPQEKQQEKTTWDRTEWEKEMTPESVALCDDILELVRDFAPDPELNFESKNDIRFKVNDRINRFAFCKPIQKKFKLGISQPKSDLFESQLIEAGLKPQQDKSSNGWSYKKKGFYYIYFPISKSYIKKYSDFLTTILKTAYRNREQMKR